MSPVAPTDERRTTASSAGRGKRVVTSSPGGASPIASPTRTAVRPRRVAISPAVTTSRRGSPAGAKTWPGGRLLLLFAADRDALTSAQSPGVQTDISHPLAGGRALDLEDAARHSGLWVSGPARPRGRGCPGAAHRYRCLPQAQPVNTGKTRPRRVCAAGSSGISRPSESTALVGNEGSHDRFAVLRQDSRTKRRGWNKRRDDRG